MINGGFTEELLKLLQEKVSAEMARRKLGDKPLTQYAGITYKNPTTSGNLLKPDVGKATIDLLLKIADIDGLNESYQSYPGVKIPEQFNSSLIDLVNKYALEREQDPSSCRSSCTGLCDVTCVGSCIAGCSGGCISCTGCTGGCDGCSGCSGCGGACSRSCSGGCEGCGGQCSSGCTGCGGGCQNTSYGSACGGGCEGCSRCGGFCGSSYSE